MTYIVNLNSILKKLYKLKLLKYIVNLNSTSLSF